MNVRDLEDADPASFALNDLLGIDRWDTTWTAAFSSLTTVGALTTASRFRVVGRQCFFEVKVSAATSIASTAGTTYFALPRSAMGLAGQADMVNDTTHIAVGSCAVDVTDSRCYLPTQVASGNTFLIAGWFEV